MSKITRQQIAIIGIILSVLVGVGVYFGLIRPLEQPMATAKAKYEQQKAIADTRPQKEADKLLALQEVAKAKAEWKVYEDKYMPNIDISKDLFTAMQARWTFETEKLGPRVRSYLYADKSVRINSAAIAVPPPPSDPNKVAEQRYYQIKVATVSVSGTFENILKHVERWNRFKHLVRVDGLTLSGVSPRLTTTYDVTVFVFVRGDTPGAPVPVPAGGAGAGGGGFGGPPGFGGGDGAISSGPGADVPLDSGGSGPVSTDR